MLSASGELWNLLLIFGLAGVTVLTRCFFFILDRPWTLPVWAQRALHYAPAAALSGVIAPEIFMTGGQLVGTWQDARLFATAVGVALFFWRRSVMLTLVGGMLVYLPLHLGLGW